MSVLKKIILVSVAVLSMFSVHAQEIQASLDAAQSAYAADRSLEARENLQQSLINLNSLIGKEIIGLMPGSLGGLQVNKAEDNIIGDTGFASLLVSRMYGLESTNHIKVTLANESPMVAMVNVFLSNSMLSGLMASQTGQKKVTVSGYVGMLERSEGEDSPITYTINVPLGDSLFTMESTGFDNENDVVNMAQQIALEKIAALLK